MYKKYEVKKLKSYDYYVYLIWCLNNRVYNNICISAKLVSMINDKYCLNIEYKSNHFKKLLETHGLKTFSMKTNE